MPQDKIDILRKNLTIEGAIDAISNFEDNHTLETTENLVKWKSYQGQVVVESNDFFYKIYEENDDGIGPFNSEVRNRLAEVYAGIGIDWKIVTFVRDGKIFDFEQREKIRESCESDGPFEKILLSFSALQDKVETLLNFDLILEQLKAENSIFAPVKKLKLMRYCVNKYDDYGIWMGQAVLFDDADWYIVPVDETGNVVVLSPETEVSVNTEFGDYIFSSKMSAVDSEYKENSQLPAYNQVTHGWYLRKPHGREKIDEPKTVSGNTSALMQCKVSEIERVVEFASNHPQERFDFNVHTAGFSGNSHFVTIKKSKEFRNPQLYKKLETLDRSNVRDDIWVLSCLNEQGLKMTNEERIVWSFHMDNIKTYYPFAQRLTKVYLTNDFCEECLDGRFNVASFVERFDTELEFKLQREHTEFFPSRKTFRKFLLGCVKEHNCRVNTTFADDFKLHESAHLAGYCDCDDCIICDCNNILESARLARG